MYFSNSENCDWGRYVVFRLWCIKIWLRPRQGKKALLVWPKSLGLVRYLRPLQSPIPCVLYVNKRAGSHNWEALGHALLTCCLYCLSLALCTVRPGGGWGSCDTRCETPENGPVHPFCPTPKCHGSQHWFSQLTWLQHSLDCLKMNKT